MKSNAESCSPMLQHVSLAVPVRQPQYECPVKVEIVLSPEDILDNLDLVECLAGLEQPGRTWQHEANFTLRKVECFKQEYAVNMSNSNVKYSPGLCVPQLSCVSHVRDS